MRPFQTPHQIFLAKQPNSGAWSGAHQFAQDPDISKYLTTKQDYTENGGEYFREHAASNLFFQTPAPIVVDTLE